MGQFSPLLTPTPLQRVTYRTVKDSSLALPLVVLPLLWLADSIFRRRRQAARKSVGLCPRCGYDLRATPGRCPECGTIVTTTSTCVAACSTS